ncbi:MAG: hypothetical protein U5N26_05285 [Candidatus Marinimicrobia bacterium]|nr:hypothetical protein [Candidatus Neomarinimicrobiota bacterium]
MKRSDVRTGSPASAACVVDKEAPGGSLAAAYMSAANIAEACAGIRSLVEAVLRLVKQGS